MNDKLYSVRMRATGKGGVHISGAECIVPASMVRRQSANYTKRALAHPRGTPTGVVVTVEQLQRKPRKIPILPVSTNECSSPDMADAELRRELRAQGISARACSAGMRILRSTGVMRGAAIVEVQSGKRLTPEHKRGVRATRMGIDPVALKRLKARLTRRGINNSTVIEALTLACKVAAAPGVVAEVCASDDPGYTTGYLASSISGYTRITNIKPMGSMSGGRVIFVKGGADIDKLVSYLENTAVMVY